MKRSRRGCGRLLRACGAAGGELYSGKYPKTRTNMRLIQSGCGHQKRVCGPIPVEWCGCEVVSTMPDGCALVGSSGKLPITWSKQRPQPAGLRAPTACLRSRGRGIVFGEIPQSAKKCSFSLKFLSDNVCILPRYIL